MTASLLLHPSPAQRVANLRAALASDRVPAALRARREARIAQLEAELAEAPRELGDIAPALEKWRREILANAAAHPLERAAAWELTALELERFGCTEDARDARYYAIQALCPP